MRLSLLLTLASPVSAAADDSAERFVLQGGTTFLLVLGPLSATSGKSLEVSVQAPIAARYACTGGARIDLDSGTPEVFARISVTAQISAWRPAAGFELGASGWNDDEPGDALLEEARATSRDGLSPIYLGLHAAPLRFELLERVLVSVLDLQLATHVAPVGRYLRVHIGMLSVGFTP
jgi:hypothetical protein